VARGRRGRGLLDVLADRLRGRAGVVTWAGAPPAGSCLCAPLPSTALPAPAPPHPVDLVEVGRRRGGAAVAARERGARRGLRGGRGNGGVAQGRWRRAEQRRAAPSRAPRGRAQRRSSPPPPAPALPRSPSRRPGGPCAPRTAPAAGAAPASCRGRGTGTTVRGRGEGRGRGLMGGVVCLRDGVGGGAGSGARDGRDAVKQKNPARPPVSRPPNPRAPAPTATLRA
jgi:hypothetical protein